MKLQTNEFLWTGDKPMPQRLFDKTRRAPVVSKRATKAPEEDVEQGRHGGARNLSHMRKVTQLELALEPSICERATSACTVFETGCRRPDALRMRKKRRRLSGTRQPQRKPEQIVAPRWRWWMLIPALTQIASTVLKALIEQWHK
jgi:hypothetical protein